MSTRLLLVDVYADRLHAALLEQPCATVDEIHTHPSVGGLHQDTVQRVIERLTADGRITEDDHGRLVVAPLPEAA